MNIKRGVAYIYPWEIEKLMADKNFYRLWHKDDYNDLPIKTPHAIGWYTTACFTVDIVVVDCHNQDVVDEN